MLFKDFHALIPCNGLHAPRNIIFAVLYQIMQFGPYHINICDFDSHRVIAAADVHRLFSWDHPSFDLFFGEVVFDDPGGLAQLVAH